MSRARAARFAAPLAAFCIAATAMSQASAEGAPGAANPSRGPNEATSRPGSAACALEAWRWRKRVLLVFAPGPSDPRLIRERGEARVAMMMGARGDDLDLVVITVDDHAFPCGSDALEALMRSIGVRRGDFRVVLIGKDGGVKLSSGRIVKGAALARAIEAMPMRREERARRGW